MSRTHACAALLCAAVVSPALAQTPSTVSEPPVPLFGVVAGDAMGAGGLSAVEQAIPTAVDQTQKAKRGEPVIAPMPMVNPTLENGLALVAGYLYRIDPDDQTTAPSVSGVGAFKTSNGSWGAALLQSLHLGHDRVRLLGVFAYGDVNYAYYGIGQTAGDAGASIQLNQAGPVGLVDGLLRVGRRWYLGGRYQMLHMTVTTAAIPLPGGPTLPELDADLRSAALGPRVEYDSRDSAFYPRIGMQLQGVVGFYGEAVGGRRTYQVYQAWLNRYHAIGPRHVLAWHVGACGVDGSVAFYDLCMLGRSKDLRGYTLGQYRDRAMVAAQAEWRTELWWRFGAVGFIGEGEVAPDFGAFTWKNALPGAGAGLRFTVAKRNHVNLRADYAWGKDSRAFYFSVAEAF